MNDDRLTEIFAAILDLRDATAHGFRTVHARLDEHDRRFEAPDRRFEDVEHRMNVRFDRIDKRFDRLDARFDRLEVRAGTVEGSVQSFEDTR